MTNQIPGGIHNDKKERKKLRAIASARDQKGCLPLVGKTDLWGLCHAKRFLPFCLTSEHLFPACTRWCRDIWFRWAVPPLVRRPYQPGSLVGGITNLLRRSWGRVKNKWVYFEEHLMKLESDRNIKCKLTDFPTITIQKVKYTLPNDRIVAPKGASFWVLGCHDKCVANEVGQWFDEPEAKKSYLRMLSKCLWVRSRLCMRSSRRSEMRLRSTSCQRSLIMAKASDSPLILRVSGECNS